MASVEIATVNPGVVTIEFVQSLLRTLADPALNERHELSFSWLKGLYVGEMREDMVERFLETDKEWLLFVDSDIEWVPDDVRLLLASADEWESPVVSGVYVSHFWDHVGPVAWKDEPQGKEIDWRQGGMVEAAAVGAGFLLIHRRVLVEVRRRFGSAFASWRENGKTWGEDSVFCDRVRDLGITIFVNADVLVGHIKSVNLTPA